MKIVADENLARALFTLNSAKADTQEAMREQADESVTGTWAPALASAAGTKPETRILADGAQADIGPGSIVLHAANGGPLSGGLIEDQWPAIEYGMDPKQIVAPNRRKTIRLAGSGREMKVGTRVWVGNNLRARNEDGYVVWPTVRQHGPRFVAAWIFGLVGVFDGSPFDIRKG